MARVAIVGAGISGLAAAYHLQRHGQSVTVFERRPQPGGLIGTTRRDGFLVEHGPNALQDRGEALQALIEALGLATQQRFAPARATRYVVRGGVPTALPTSPPALLTSTYFSWPARLRLLTEPLRRARRRAEPESVADFTRRRLGREVLDYAVAPFVGGIFAGDPEQLAVRHAFPKLYALEQQHGSLLRGLWRSRKARGEGPPRLFAFDEGLATLPHALGAALGDALQLDTEVTSVHPTNGSWSITTRQGARAATRLFDAVVYSAPLHRLGPLGLDAQVDLSPLQEVCYAPVSVVALGYRREHVAHPLDGFGMLVPAVAPGHTILGTLFSSSLFAGRAPAGHVLLTSFVGGARRPEAAQAPDETLRAGVHEELAALLGIAAPPVFAHVVRWPKAIPQFGLDYDAVLRRLDQIERRYPRLHFAGNYRGGVSVPDAAASGVRAAEQVLAAFEDRPTRSDRAR